MTPEQVCEEILQSGLRGRGGAGFPTGLKWKFALQEDAPQKFVIVNGDEGDPGAYMDRTVMEDDPHRVLEGMIICAYAIGATYGYLYIRGEYPIAIQRIRRAIRAARRRGILGQSVLGTDFSFDADVRIGAGAFVCGEETALIHSVEGKRGMPRIRPPYPSASGLWGKPTVINNVETMGNVPSIITKGAEWFAGNRHREKQGHQGLRAGRPASQHRPDRSADGHHPARNRLRHRRRRCPMTASSRRRRPAGPAAAVSPATISTRPSITRA